MATTHCYRNPCVWCTRGEPPHPRVLLPSTSSHPFLHSSLSTLFTPFLDLSHHITPINRKTRRVCRSGGSTTGSGSHGHGPVALLLRSDRSSACRYCILKPHNPRLLLRSSPTGIVDDTYRSQQGSHHEARLRQPSGRPGRHLIDLSAEGQRQRCPFPPRKVRIQ